MQIDIKELEPCRYSIYYETGVEDILVKTNEVLKAFKKAPAPGFRKGKASIEAIKLHYKDQINESVKRALIEDAYHNTLFEKKIKPHGPPVINGAFLGLGKFTCDFEIKCKPDFNVCEYKNLQVPKPGNLMTEQEYVENFLQTLRVRAGTVVPYTEDDFIELNDNVILNYEAFIDNNKIDSLSAEGEALTVGKSAVAEFDSNLLGMVVGESREFEIVVPESSLPSMAGKLAKFNVTFIMGTKVIPAALDDALAQKAGKKDLYELRSVLQDKANHDCTINLRKSISEYIGNYLVQNTVCSVPNWMSLSEAQYLAQQSKLDWNVLEDQDKERYIEFATLNVKLALILDKIREIEVDAQLSDNEVFNMIKQNVAKYNTASSFDDAMKELNKNGYLQILMSRIRDEHTMDYIIKNSQIIE
jgi:trigger factor